MTQSRISALTVVLVLLALALGVAAGLVITQQRYENLDQSGSSTGVSELPLLLEIDQKLEGLDKTLKTMARESKDARTPAVHIESDMSTERVPALGTSDRAPSKSEEGEPAPAGWVAVLDPEIAGVLVERGLTPYSQGVGPLVTRASNEVRAAQSEYDKAADPLKEFIAANLTDPESDRLTVQLGQLKAQLTQRRRNAIALLVKALDAR